MIPIVEIFRSLQGEVSHNPAIFIRSGLCCFSCSGFGCKTKSPQGEELIGCDTIRAVNPLFKNNWTYFKDWQELVNEINKYLIFDQHNRKQDIIWTGGEPTIHWHSNIMQQTLAYYISRGHDVTIETNGSMDFDLDEIHKMITFSISVKLSNSGEPKEKRFNVNQVNKILKHSPKSYLKFVINPKTYDQDIIEIREFLGNLSIRAKVYFMPLGSTREQLQENTQFVVEKCIENNFSYTDRIHIRAWDSKEGV